MIFFNLKYLLSLLFSSIILWDTLFSCEGKHCCSQIVPSPILAPVQLSKSNSEFTLIWSAVPNAKKYYAEMSENNDFTHVTSLYFGKNTSFRFSNHKSGVYYYRIIGVSISGHKSKPSNVISHQIP